MNRDNIFHDTHINRQYRNAQVASLKKSKREYMFGQGTGKLWNSLLQARSINGFQEVIR